MSEPIGTPVRRPKGRAATKAHHRKPSHDVAKRAFASVAGRGKALQEYAAEMIKSGKAILPDDITRLVDSGDFGRWLESKHERTVEKVEIIANVANPNWTLPKPVESEAAKVKRAGDEFRKHCDEVSALREQFALKHDRQEAVAYCLMHRISDMGEFDKILARITRDRQFKEGWKRAKNAR
jgi:hypothetical protein